jgi:hypothetical protein
MNRAVRRPTAEAKPQVRRETKPRYEQDYDYEMLARDTDRGKGMKEWRANVTHFGSKDLRANLHPPPMRAYCRKPLPIRVNP